MSEKQFGFIGAGNIAGAIIGGALTADYIKSENINIYDVLPDKMNSFSKYSVRCCSSVTELVNRCNYIFLTVKPQVYEAVLAEIRGAVTPDKCLISVAAGRTIGYVKKQIGFDCKVVRVMPNTPLMVGGGASALVLAPPVGAEDFDVVKGFFDSSGKTCVVSEDLIDAVTGVSGSSPAFVFRFAREIIKVGESFGMTSDDAISMVAQTLIGSARMILESGMSLDELIRMVTSPNGTTEAGLKAMDQHGFDAAVAAAVEAAIRRSAELKQ